MYVSRCQSVDMRIDIVKYEEGHLESLDGGITKKPSRQTFEVLIRIRFAFTGFY